MKAHKQQIRGIGIRAAKAAEKPVMSRRATRRGANK